MTSSQDPSLEKRAEGVSLNEAKIPRPARGQETEAGAKEHQQLASTSFAFAVQRPAPHSSLSRETAPATPALDQLAKQPPAGPKTRGAVREVNTVRNTTTEQYRADILERILNWAAALLSRLDQRLFSKKKSLRPATPQPVFNQPQPALTKKKRAGTTLDPEQEEELPEEAQTEEVQRPIAPPEDPPPASAALDKAKREKDSTAGERQKFD